MVFSLILACLTKALAGIKVSGKLQHTISGTKKGLFGLPNGKFPFQFALSLYSLLGTLQKKCVDLDWSPIVCYYLLLLIVWATTINSGKRMNCTSVFFVEHFLRRGED